MPDYTKTMEPETANAANRAAVRADRTAEAQGPLTPDEVAAIDRYWRAANYLSVGQIYLLDNPLLRAPMAPEHIKPRLLGHWGTSPGLNFIYAHLNRVIRERDLDMMLVVGPGHGGPAIVANTWLEGSWTERYHEVSMDERGMKRLFKQFSFPGGIPSHCAPDVPGSIHEGGELGYSLAHAMGAALDNSDLFVVCVVGDGESETGPLATSWWASKYLNPVTDGAIIPILHLNGYKIANPTLPARVPEEDLTDMLRGFGWEPRFVDGDDLVADHAPAHQAMAAALDATIDDIRRIKATWHEDRAESGTAEVGATTDEHEGVGEGIGTAPRWPMIVMRTPKGWTGPKMVDGHKVEGSWRAHQVPLAGVRENAEHLKLLEQWMKSYRPEELFDASGAPLPEITALAPKGTRRLGDNPHANGGLLLHDLTMPGFRDYAVDVPVPGRAIAEATRICGTFLRDVMSANMDNFRVFGPDETASNRLDAIYEASKKRWLAGNLPQDADGGELSAEGRVMEMLSETTLLGWLEGYTLTGRHGLFNSYEAFVHIVDSMFNQHAKWLDVSKNEIAWREPVSSANYLLSSHVWRQDHNGFSHQDPGFIDNVVNKKGDVVRVYLPPDANCLLSVMDHCLRSRDYVNVIVAGKQPALQYLDMDSAIKHCTAGIGIWEWASNDYGEEPDVVMACAGDVPTLETLAAVDLLRRNAPDIKVRVVNVVDLMTLQPAEEHPHGLSEKEFDAIFTTSSPIIFAYHGYPWLIHRLTYRRANHKNMHVRGYKEEGTTTTPFDMVVLNDLDRFQLFSDAVERIPRLSNIVAYARQFVRDKLVDHREYITTYGIDMPEIRDWQWPGGEDGRWSGESAAGSGELK